MFQVYQLAEEVGWNYVDCSIEKTERGLEVEVFIAPNPYARHWGTYYQVKRLLDPSLNYNENIFQEITCELRGFLIEYGHLSPGRGL